MSDPPSNSTIRRSLTHGASSKTDYGAGHKQPRNKTINTANSVGRQFYCSNSRHPPAHTPGSDFFPETVKRFRKELALLVSPEFRRRAVSTPKEWVVISRMITNQHGTSGEDKFVAEYGANTMWTVPPSEAHEGNAYIRYMLVGVGKNETLATGEKVTYGWHQTFQKSQQAFDLSTRLFLALGDSYLAPPGTVASKCTGGDTTLLYRGRWLLHTTYQHAISILDVDPQDYNHTENVVATDDEISAFIGRAVTERVTSTHQRFQELVSAEKRESAQSEHLALLNVHVLGLELQKNQSETMAEAALSKFISSAKDKTVGPVARAASATACAKAEQAVVLASEAIILSREKIRNQTASVGIATAHADDAHRSLLSRLNNKDEVQQIPPPTQTEPIVPQVQAPPLPSPLHAPPATPPPPPPSPPPVHEPPETLQESPTKKTKLGHGEEQEPLLDLDEWYLNQLGTETEGALGFMNGTEMKMDLDMDVSKLFT